MEHWQDGGETSLRNSLLLCHFHHRLVHEGGWTVEWVGDGQVSFYGARGHGVLQGRPVRGRSSRRQLPAALVARLLAENRLQGADPDAYTAGARWKRERDIPDKVYFRATEAV